MLVKNMFELVENIKNIHENDQSFLSIKNQHTCFEGQEVSLYSFLSSVHPSFKFFVIALEIQHCKISSFVIFVINI